MKIDIVVTCLKRDLPLLERAYRNLKIHTPIKHLNVITPKENFPEFERTLGPDVILHDENVMIAGVTLEKLKVIPMAKMSQGHGWYFQQLLKLQFAFLNEENDYYLIWDADTIPLRHMEFFDEKNRMWITKATEYHQPYFKTYRNLLGEEPNRGFSFIAQHLVIQKSVAREMLQAIEHHCPGDENWAWKIMRNLAGEGSNRFSEFETYGHYIKNRYPERIAIRELPWLRHGARVCGRNPSHKDLVKLGEKYCYASFEASDNLYRRSGRWVRNHLRKLIRFK
jgi:hypothetical protein